MDISRNRREDLLDTTSTPLAAAGSGVWPPTLLLIQFFIAFERIFQQDKDDPPVRGEDRELYRYDRFPQELLPPESAVRILDVFLALVRCFVLRPKPQECVGVGIERVFEKVIVYG